MSASAQDNIFSLYLLKIEIFGFFYTKMFTFSFITLTSIALIFYTSKLHWILTRGWVKWEFLTIVILNEHSLKNDSLCRSKENIFSFTCRLSIGGRQTIELILYVTYVALYARCLRWDQNGTPCISIFKITRCETEAIETV